MIGFVDVTVGRTGERHLINLNAAVSVRDDIEKQRTVIELPIMQADGPKFVATDESAARIMSRSGLRWPRLTRSDGGALYVNPTHFVHGARVRPDVVVFLTTRYEVVRESLAQVAEAFGLSREEAVA